MPKMRTNKAMRKRFKVSKNGKISYKRAGSRHLKGNKTGTKIRQLRKDRQLESSSAQAKKILRLIVQN